MSASREWVADHAKLVLFPLFVKILALYQGVFNALIINADDFYGKDAFKVASEFIDNNNDDIAIIGYKVINTITDNGAVKRGVLKESNGKLLEIIESSIEKKDGVIYATPLGTQNTKEIKFFSI